MRTIALLADRVERSARADPASIVFTSQDIAAEALRKALDALPWLEEKRVTRERR